MNTFETWLNRADPGATAVADDVGSLTYGELLQHSAALADHFREQYGRGAYLMLKAERATSFPVALLAISFSGNIPVPVDPTAPPSVLDAIAARCGGATFVEPNDNQEASWTGRIAEPADTALVLFTSGTSGVPKGVPVSWENLAHSIKTVSGYLDYQQFPSAAIVLPLHYSYALLTQLFCMLYVGGTARLFGSFRNPIKFAKAVEGEGLQTFCGVPSTYHALCAIHRMATLEMPGVRVLCSAGAAMDRSMMPEIRTIFPNARFFDNYGMTEATPRISYVRDDDPRFCEPTCGRVINGMEVCVVDETSHERLPEGEHGIVSVRGPNVFAGYLNDTESTQAAFTNDGFLLSGDYGFLRDGYIYLSGRADDIFNVGGEKVAPLEIERALAEHPLVVSSAVSKIEDDKRGTLAVAYLELAGEVSRKDLIDFLQQHLSPAKIPYRYFLVSSLPLTANGKLQRLRLGPSEDFIVGELR